MVCSEPRQHSGFSVRRHKNKNNQEFDQTLIHSINESVNEGASPTFPLVEQPRYDISSMNTSTYNENNYRQTHNVCNNPNKRTQLFVNQKEPKNLTSRTLLY